MGDDFAMGYAMGQDNNNNCNGNDWFGGGGIWGLLIIALLFGYGGFGAGGGLFGGMLGGGNGALTRADITAGFQFQDLQNGVRGIQQGLCDGFYAVNTGLLTGFNGIQAQMAANAAQSASCCCETQRLMERGFADIGYAMATNTNSVIQNQHNDTDRVIAKLDAMEQTRMAEKLDALRSENLALKFAASQASQNAFITANQEAQTATLLRRLGAECPSPAYLVNAPTPVTFPVNACGQVQFCNGSGCGCGYTT